jgi:hypothetical protein
MQILLLRVVELEKHRNKESLSVIGGAPYRREAVTQSGFLDQWANFSCAGKVDGPNGRRFSWWAKHLWSNKVLTTLEKYKRK